MANEFKPDPMANMELLPVYQKGKLTCVYAINDGDVIDVKLHDQENGKGAWLRCFFVRRNSAAGMITVQTPTSVRVLCIGWIEKIVIQLSIGEGKRD